MDKVDFKKTERKFYSGKKGHWERLTIPAMQYLTIDGIGAPGGTAYSRSIAALYPLAYGIKFKSKSRGKDFVVPPLEGLWWADDMAAFSSGDRDEWRWTMMIRMPDSITVDDLFATRTGALLKLAKKGETDTDSATMNSVRLQSYTAGDCLQTLHVGPYKDEGPILADLHERVMPEMGLDFAGNHQEIYLGDPRRVAPEKLKTILRQPVKPI